MQKSLVETVAGGRREVKCTTGRIDVLGDSEVVEVKRASLWKSGLGQLLAYAVDHPDKTRRLHLFQCDGRDLDLVRRVCAVYGVDVTTDTTIEATSRDLSITQ